MTAFKMSEACKKLEKQFHETFSIIAITVQEQTNKLKKAGYDVIDPRLISIAISVIKGYDDEFLIRNFIQYSQGCWDEIHEKNEKHFLENSEIIFSYLPGNAAKHIRQIFVVKNVKGEPAVNQKIKNVLWKVLHDVIVICIKYLQIKGIDSHKVYQQINLEHHNKIWHRELQN